METHSPTLPLLYHCVRASAIVPAVLAFGAFVVSAGPVVAKAPKSAGDDGVAIYRNIARDDEPAPEWTGRGAPRWFRFTRERLKAGGQANVLKLHARRSRELTDGQWPRNTVVLQPLSGPQEIWSLTGYNQTYAWGDEDRAMLDRAPDLKERLDALEQEAAAFINEKRDLVLRYKPDLSYQPDFEWSEVRVLTFTVRKIRKAEEDKFREWCRKVSARHAQFNIPEHLLIYSTAFGDTDKVYFQIAPFRSVRDMDLVSDAHPASKDSQELFDLMKSAVEWEESYIFHVDPAASHVTPAFATPAFARAIDPFWGVNPHARIASPAEIREAMALEKVPPAVREAIKQKVGTGRFLKVERVQRGDATVYAIDYWEKPKYFADGRPAIYKVPDVAKKKVRVSDLPAALRTAVEDEIAACMSYELNLRDGLNQYELAMFLPGRSNLLSASTIKDVIFDADGGILAVESEIDLEDVPEAPRELIRSAVAGGRLLNVQQLTKDGTIIYQGRIGKSCEFLHDGRVAALDRVTSH